MSKFTQLGDNRARNQIQPVWHLKLAYLNSFFFPPEFLMYNRNFIFYIHETKGDLLSNILPFSKIIAKIATSENSTTDFVHFFRQLRPSHWKFKRFVSPLRPPREEACMFGIIQLEIAKPHLHNSWFKMYSNISVPLEF